MEDDDTVLTIDGGTPKDGAPMVHLEYNLHSKSCLTGEDASNIRSVPVNRPPEPPVIISAYPRKEFIPYKSKEPKVFTPPALDIVEQLKKAPTHVSLWDLLSIPE